MEPQFDFFGVPPGTVERAIEAAKQRRDAGMQQAAEHADEVTTGWQDEAACHLREFIAQRAGAPFLAEDFVQWSRYRLTRPPDGRAFGATIKRAAAAGLIARIGYAPANTSNRSPKCQWQERSHHGQ